MTGAPMSTTGGSPTPARAREPELSASSESPAAKRPTTMAEPGGPLEDGPEMPTAQMSRAIYALQIKVASVETWPASVSTALVYHARHIYISRMFATAISSQFESTMASRTF